MNTIYADIYFLVNFSMDFLTLFITCKLLHLRLRLARVCFSAAVGALYAVLTLAFHGQSSPITLLLTVLLPALMSYIAFGFSGFRSFIRAALTFWISSFLLGGAMTALYYFAGRLMKKMHISINGTVHTFYSDIPLWLFIFAALFCMLFTFVWNRIADKRSRARSAELEIFINNNHIKVLALCDSGNMLTEPLSGRSVVFISTELAESLCETWSLCRELELPKGLFPQRARIIPYKSINGQGLMLGYIPDRALVNNRECDICLCLSKGKNYAGYKAIVSTDLL